MTIDAGPGVGRANGAIARNRRRSARAAATLVVGTILVACWPFDTDGDSRALIELERARRAWRVAGIADYDFVLERTCFCGEEARGPVAMEVRDGVVVSRTYVGSGEPVPADFHPWFPPVEGLFDQIEDAIDRDAHRINAEYDPVRGHPVRIWIDYRENVADEEQGWRILSLEPAA